jgi:MFS family permease
VGAGLISSLGSWLLVLAIPAHILTVTGSLRDTGLTLAAAYLPQLVLGPVAGVVADRWDRRRLMIAANLFCAGAVAVIRAFLDRAQPRNLLTASLTANAGAYFLLFTSSSLATALPAAVAVGMCGSMTLVTQQTTLQRVIADAVLGRVSAVFLTGEAAATLIGSVAGPFLAQAVHLAATAAAASLLILSAAALALFTVPRLPAIMIGGPPLPKPGGDS